MARTRGLTMKGPAFITRNGIVYRTAKSRPARGGWIETNSEVPK